MNKNEISQLFESSVPLLILETHEERRAVSLLKNIAISIGLPVSTWSIATGMQRMDLNLDTGTDLKKPDEALSHIRTAGFDGVYILLDFHPYLKDPLHVRQLNNKALDLLMRNIKGLSFGDAHRFSRLDGTVNRVTYRLRCVAIRFNFTRLGDSKILVLAQTLNSGITRQFARMTNGFSGALAVRGMVVQLIVCRFHRLELAHQGPG